LFEGIILSDQESKKNLNELDEFYKKQILLTLDGIKDLVVAEKIPRGSVLTLTEFVNNWDKIKKKKESS
jgi:hypothetical protein